MTRDELKLEGVTYAQNNQPLEAKHCFERVLAINPSDASAHNKSSMLTMLGRQEQAIQVLHQILEIEPTHPTARYHLAKFGQGDTPSTAPASYITDLFNEYAATFDDQLIGKLSYQTPQQIGQVVKSIHNRGLPCPVA